jgi:hypothetical protein
MLHTLFLDQFDTQHLSFDVVGNQLSWQDHNDGISIYIVSVDLSYQMVRFNVCSFIEL